MIGKTGVLTFAATAALTLATAVAAVAVVGCRGPHPPDTAGDRRLGPGQQLPETRAGSLQAGQVGVPPPPQRVPEKVAPESSRSRVVVRSRSHALATSRAKLFYSDIDEDGVFAIDKAGGEPTRLGRRAPESGDLALDGDAVVWVATTGDAVLRSPVSASGGTATVIREGGIFSSVAAHGGHVFIGEAVGSGGALTRVDGTTLVRVASFEGPPRGLVADDTFAYVLTPTRLYKIAYDAPPHERSEVTTLASGTAFEHPQLDGQNVYFVAGDGRTRSLVRAEAAGGPLTTLARDIRDAPIAVAGGEIFYFDATRPQIRAVRSDAKGQDRVANNAPRVVAEHEGLSAPGPTAFTTDGTELFVATGDGPTAVVRAFPIR